MLAFYKAENAQNPQMLGFKGKKVLEFPNCYEYHDNNRKFSYLLRQESWK